MRNNILNFIKFGRNVDINSIDMFEACLEYNSKIQPKVKSELVRWPIYREYWNYLNKNNFVKAFDIVATVGLINISGDFIKCPFIHENNNKAVFLLHGITNTRYWLFKQAYVFLKAGYNVVWYDARNHGKSGSAPTTFGKNEASDLNDVITYIDENYLEINNYILYGYSLGGASIIMWGALIANNSCNRKVKAIICDSVFSRLEKNYNEQVHNHTYLPTNIMINLLRNQAKRNVGPDALSLLQPIKYLKYWGKVPAVFLHGKSDRFVSYTNSEELYREKIRYEKLIRSKLFIVDNANHGQSFLVGDNYPDITDEYDQSLNIAISKLVLNFINLQVNKIKY